MPAADAGRIPTAGTADRSVMRRLRGVALVLALFAFATAWNLTKPYHIDDPAYLELAQWIAAHPLHPMQGTVFWGAERPTSVADINQPHLYPYAMAAWGSLFGWGEVSMHALMALFALASIAFMYRLARAVLPERASLATFLVAASPAFVVGQNTMVDIPTLALWLLFFVILLERRKEPGAERLRYAVAGIVCGAAILTKYTSLILIPAIVLDGALRRRREAGYGVAVAVAMVLLWSGFNFWDYGSIHMLARMDARGVANVLDPAKWVLCLGAAAPAAFAIAGAWLDGRERRIAVAGVASLAVGMGVFLALVAALCDGFYDRAVSTAAFAAFFLLSGSLLCVLALLALPWRRAALETDTAARWMLAYWVAGSAAFIVLFAPFMAMRHVLLALPAVVLLALMAIRTRMRPPWTGAALVATLVSTSLIASADRWYAGIYRDEAKRLRDALPAAARVWTVGHWGWQWYAQADGMSQIIAGEGRASPGDFVVYPERVHSQPLPTELVVSSVREIPVVPTNWVRSFAAPYAGFYATTTFAQLPWAVRREPIEVFHVLRIDGVRGP